jgi:hypothetical protein
MLEADRHEVGSDMQEAIRNHWRRWHKDFEESYVINLISRAKSTLEEASTALLTHCHSETRTLSDTASIGRQSTRSKVTVPQPFLLTVPRPRPVPIPKPIPSHFHARDAPQSSTISYGNELLKSKITQQEKRQFEFLKRHENQNAATPVLRTARRSTARPDSVDGSTSDESKIPEWADPEERLKKFQISVARVKPVRQNMTALLREDKLLQKQIESERRRLNDHVRLALDGTVLLSEQDFERQMQDRQRQGKQNCHSSKFSNSRYLKIQWRSNYARNALTYSLR